MTSIWEFSMSFNEEQLQNFWKTNFGCYLLGLNYQLCTFRDSTLLKSLWKAVNIAKELNSNLLRLSILTSTKSTTPVNRPQCL